MLIAVAFTPDTPNETAAGSGDIQLGRCGCLMSRGGIGIAATVPRRGHRPVQCQVD